VLAFVLKIGTSTVFYTSNLFFFCQSVSFANAPHPLLQRK